jgi:hypothetical protein
MPGITAVSTSPVVIQHTSASDFLSATYPTLQRHEASANIVLAHALKLAGKETAETSSRSTNEADVQKCLNRQLASPSKARQAGQFWLTVWSTSSAAATPTLDLVLASVSNSLGDYPIFLWTPKSPASISSLWLSPRIEAVATHLHCIVPVSRVFSVFGMTLLVKNFTQVWTSLTGVSIEPEPFYAALYSFCNAHTFRDCDAQLPSGHFIRRAVESDLPEVAQLCKEFADDSVSTTFTRCNLTLNFF